MKRKILTAACGVLLLGGAAGYGIGANKATSQMSEPSLAYENASLSEAYAEDSGECSVELVEADKQELYEIYSQYGIHYDAAKDKMWYKGKLVRWFEDYYLVDDKGEGWAGVDFFNKEGTVDVHAVRDLQHIVRNEDGSFEPSGTLIGVEEFSQKEFAARDIESIKNPPVTAAIEGGEVSPEEMKKIALEYQEFGITYDEQRDQWYLNGEKIRYFLDIMTSNGEKRNSGKFSGSMRTFGTEKGSIDVYTVRDFNKLDKEGNGTLTGIKKYSQQKFDEHTKEGL